MLEAIGISVWLYVFLTKLRRWEVMINQTWRARSRCSTIWKESQPLHQRVYLTWTACVIACISWTLAPSFRTQSWLRTRIAAENTGTFNGDLRFLPWRLVSLAIMEPGSGTRQSYDRKDGKGFHLRIMLTLWTVFWTSSGLNTVRLTLLLTSARFCTGHNSGDFDGENFRSL